MPAGGWGGLEGGREGCWFFMDSMDGMDYMDSMDHEEVIPLRTASIVSKPSILAAPLCP